MPMPMPIPCMPIMPMRAPVQVVDAMRQFGAYADQAREALSRKDWKTLGEVRRSPAPPHPAPPCPPCPCLAPLWSLASVRHGGAEGRRPHFTRSGRISTPP